MDMFDGFARMKFVKKLEFLQDVLRGNVPVEYVIDFATIKRDIAETIYFANINRDEKLEEFGKIFYNIKELGNRKQRAEYLKAAKELDNLIEFYNGLDLAYAINDPEEPTRKL